MQPGLTRAVPAAVLGFCGACLVVIIIRSLQGLEPVFEPQVGFILAAFVTAFSFVWGMGALDPAMQQHEHAPEVDPETGLIIPSEPEDAHAHDDEAEQSPTTILGLSIWQVAFWTILIFVVLFGLAKMPTHLTMRTSSDPSAQLSDLGSSDWTIPVLGVDTQLNQGVTLLMLVGVIFVGLVVVGGGIGFMMAHLNAGIKEVAQMDSTALPNTPGEQEVKTRFKGIGFAEYFVFAVSAFALFLLFYYVFVELLIESPNGLRIVLSLVFGISLASNFTIRPVMLHFLGELIFDLLVFASIAYALYVLFYFVLIGLPIARPAWLRIGLSVINAVGAAFTAVYPKILTRTIGQFAAHALKLLRGLPDALN